MAGVGIKFQNKKNYPLYERTMTGVSVAKTFKGFILLAPMIFIMTYILLDMYLLEGESARYSSRSLFIGTIVYMFVFALLHAGLFNSVLTRYLSDIIFQNRDQDILPCFYLALMINVLVGVIPAVPFCIHEYIIGKVALYYVFTGFCGYISMIIVYNAMLYIYAQKSFKMLALFFFIGMFFSFALSHVFVFILHFDSMYSILLALVIGLMLIASLEIAVIRSYSSSNSRRYKSVLIYMKDNWRLMVANYAYLLGLYIHNFVFWQTSMHTVIVNTFYLMNQYDVAAFLSLFTNITGIIIFTEQLEKSFKFKFKAYIDSINGGRNHDIQLSKSFMFRQLADDIVSLCRMQFIFTVIIFFAANMLLPRLGYDSTVMRIYPCLCVGFFMLFPMYGEVLFLYYFDDQKGAARTTVIFCSITCIVTMLATFLSPIWWGIGLVAGTFAAFCYGFMRLRWWSRHIDEFMFCQGTLLKKGVGKMPSNKVYDRSKEIKEEEKKQLKASSEKVEKYEMKVAAEKEMSAEASANSEDQHQTVNK